MAIEAIGSAPATGTTAAIPPFEYIKGDDAFHVWLKLPGNAGKSAADWLAATRGAPGPAGEIDVFRITSLAPDAPPEVLNTGTPSHARVELRIPRGQDGDPGPEGPPGRGEPGPDGPPGKAATVSVFGATKVPNSQGPQVVNRGTAAAAAFEFLIPEGPDGPRGRGFTPTGPWQPFTNYEVDFLVTYLGATYRRKTAGFSLSTFEAESALWEKWAAKGDQGDASTVPGPVGITWRGAWTANTAYAVRDAVSVIRPGRSGRSTVYCTTAHTSGGSYTAAQEANWTVAADSGEPPTQPVTATIATVLNLGAGAGQNHFSYQTGPTPPADGSAVTATTIAQGTLAGASYVPPPELTVTADGKRVGIYTRIDAPATSGSAYGRGEFRENGLTAATMQMDPATGTHWMRGRFRIAHLPLKNGGVKPEVVFVQLHNNNNDVLAIRTQVVVSGVDGTRSLHLVLRVNGTAAGAVRFKSPPVIGEEYDWMVKLVEGTCYVYFASTANPAAFIEPVWTSDPFQRTGDTKGTNSLGYAWGFTSGSTPVSTDASGNPIPGWYFKFGQYLQTNPAIETANASATAPYNTPQRRMYSTNPADTVLGDPLDYFAVEVSRIQHWHTGWPQPQYIDYGYAVPGSQGIEGAAATIAGAAAHALPYGQPPTVANNGTAGQALFDFGIPAGRAATVGVNAITKLAFGQNPTVVNAGTATDALLNFGIPEGKQGETGPAGTLAFRTITVAPYGQTPTVTNYGSPSAALLDVALPQGAPGRTPALTFGAVTTGQPGTNAAVSSSTAANGDVTALLTIPAGTPGTPGPQQVYVQAISPGNLNRPYLWYKTDTTTGNIVDIIVDDGKG